MAIWRNFADWDVRRVDGKRLVYDPNASPARAGGPLADANAHGQCAALADLLYKALITAGVPARQRVIWPKNPPYDGFQVAGGRVQGGQIQQPWAFEFHVIVELDSQPNNVYDPSYGIITSKRNAASVEEQWEEDHVDDLHIVQQQWVGSNPDGQDLIWVTRTNPNP